MKLKRTLAFVLSAVLLVCSTAFADAGMSAPDIEAALLKFCDSYGSSGPASDSVTVDASALPAKVDLRDRGIVPAVRNQDPWGTCWGFGSIAACEISILSDLGLTCEQFKEKYGYDLDLSERHLAWFATYHMPDVSGDTSGLSEDEIQQAGEGQHNNLEVSSPNNAHYNIGGFSTMASSVFAAGFGPAMESDVPYTANDGTKSEDADWSVDESTRFTTEFDLLDSNIYPSPAFVDSEGNYYYNEDAANAIKQSIANGHPVAIAYHADTSRPEDAKANLKGSSDYDDSYEKIYETILGMGYSEDEAEMMVVFLVTGDTSEMSEDDKTLCAEIGIYLLADEDETDDMVNQLYSGDLNTDEVLNEIAATLNNDLDKTVYINYATYAQYTDDASEAADHCVCIIGYDDDYAVTNFLEDHRPSAPGAWICRNSWGSTWGNDGYFYLSYYDKTITQVESFTFDVTNFDQQTETLEILSYDYMQINFPSALYPENEVAQACIYTTDFEAVLSSVSVFTAVENTDVALSVYLMNEGAVDPDDGTLLDQQTLHYDYAGYHRANLSSNFLIPAESRLSIVVSQTTVQNGEAIPVFPISQNESELAVDINENADIRDGGTSWYVAKVNAGESFVLDSGKWVDWKTVIDEAYAMDADLIYYVIDNHSLKLFMYPFDQIQEIHDLDTTTTDADGNTVSVCDEDGYTVVR